MTVRPQRISVASIGCFVLLAAIAESNAQSLDSTRPIVGLRESLPSRVALTNATITVAPGKTLQNATLLIDGTSIRDVGPGVEIDEDVEVLDCSGKHLYPGFIDAYYEADADWGEKPEVGNHWNVYVTPRRSVPRNGASSFGDADKRRSQGITTSLVAPAHRIVRGHSRIELLTDDNDQRHRLEAPRWQHLQLTVPRQRISSQRYPNSPMGAVALLRQTLYDAHWYGEATRASQANASLEPPIRNLDLAALAADLRKSMFVVDAPNERMALRAEQLAQEFKLPLILRGSGREYRELDAIAKMDRTILVPVAFPDAPKVLPESIARDVTLQTLLHWHHAPANAGKLANRGVSICLTTDGLDNVNDFLPNIRKAIQKGLASSEALAALTTTPAELLGIADTVGTLERGKIANVVVMDGVWTQSKSKVTDTFVAGRRYQHDVSSQASEDPLQGLWRTSLVFNRKPQKLELNVEIEGDRIKASIATVKLENVLRNRQRFSAAVPNEKLASLLDVQLPDGFSSLEFVTPRDRFNEVSGRWFSETGTPRPLKLARIERSGSSSEDDAEEVEDNPVPSDSGNEMAANIPVLYPLGAYGLDHSESHAHPERVLFRGATVWTCGDAGTGEMDVLVMAGGIEAIGQDLHPDGTFHVVDATGKHISPGMIDCHTHIATDGGVNESGQAVTAEVRIGDFVDNSDINVFRQLAGGTTTANILHGSANPIGGQNQVIKMRWGGSMEDLRFKNAPAGIKFALGENVKRNTSRYPNTRMGVEQLLRDQLLAARQYDAVRVAYEQGKRDRLPVRRDLQLDALAEIQRGERWIHCHSYRQDEILATLAVLEEFNIQIGTLQHILEGYKVADAMARHGAMGSSFSDWWAYKFEVFDAIPYNGILMHDAGVVVSFNSDFAELGRHLNTEAAKAVKYGGLEPQEALKFVTLNPAKQLRIDERVGSLEVGKDADLVIWSGPPLSTTSRCEQTWIDGKCYFSLKKASGMQQRDQELRRRLIQSVLIGDDRSSSIASSDASTAKAEAPEEQRWKRYDEYCTTRNQ
ncbi:MAG: amidohydrolase family protein [Planctomycetota bacterium]